MKEQMKKHTIKFLKLIFLGYYEYDSRKYYFNNNDEFKFFNYFLKNRDLGSSTKILSKLNSKIEEYNVIEEENDLSYNDLSHNDGFLKIYLFDSLKYSIENDKEIIEFIFHDDSSDLSNLFSKRTYFKKREEIFEVKRVNNTISGDLINKHRLTYINFRKNKSKFDEYCSASMFVSGGGIMSIAVLFDGIFVNISVVLVVVIILIIKIYQIFYTIKTTNFFISVLENSYLLNKLKWLEDYLKINEISQDIDDAIKDNNLD